ncbi:MAG: beta-galactosidase [Tepidisphaeraceae bacterium]
MPTHTITIRSTTPPPEGAFHLGTPSGPSRPTIGVTQKYLTRDGMPWLGVMGEIHYSRVDPRDWRDELLKMKAGGLDVIASYVFWIHHEEVEGDWDWTGCRDLRRFVQTCAELDLPIIVRCGPWCHGEVRNGGLPDWVLDGRCKARSSDPAFLHYARKLYTQIATQLDGLLWKQGGPVLGIQVDNEFGGPAEYLLDLKRIAIELGIDVPIYTRTGWPSTSTPMPFGELLPLYGAYAEGFWARELEPMPGHHWHAFRFERMRTDIEVGADMLGRDRVETEESAQYPYLTCEIGGGMEQSYHRRIKIDPRDVLSVTLTKIGSGSTLPGYYMYHGGTNPRGKRSTLQESQATQYWNDSPTRSYDFQAPLGQFGQVRPHFHLLRRLHSFLHDFGPALATTSVHLPDVLPEKKDDATTLRWAVRTGEAGTFVFVNNYQRLLPMPAKADTRLSVTFEDGSRIEFPPVTVPADSSFVWPARLSLGDVTLCYATAQLLARVSDTGRDYIVFGQTPGVPADFAFDGNVRVEPSTFVVERMAREVLIRNVRPGRGAAIHVESASGRQLVVVLLSDADALRCHRVAISGVERIALADVNVLTSDVSPPPGTPGEGRGEGRLRSLQGNGPNPLSAYRERIPDPDGSPVRPRERLRAWTDSAASTVPVAILPPFPSARRDGMFGIVDIPIATTESIDVTVTPRGDAGPPRAVALGYAKVAEAPTDADFEHAAVWTIEVPKTDVNARLVIDYVGDVARLYDASGNLLNDHFYNGQPFEQSLRDLAGQTLTLRILPLQKSGPIYLTEDPRSAFTQDAVAELRGVNVVITREASFTINAKS